MYTDLVAERAWPPGTPLLHRDRLRKLLRCGRSGAALEHVNALTIERAESYGSALQSPLASTLTAEGATTGTRHPAQTQRRPSIRYTSDEQFSQRLELYRGR